MLDERDDVLVEHGDVEIDVIADQRTPADEMQEIRQHLADQSAAFDIGLAQAMHLDRLGSHAGIRARDRLETLAGQDAVAADLDRRDRDDVVGSQSRPVVSQSIATTSSCGSRLEQEPVGLVADARPDGTGA